MKYTQYVYKHKETIDNIKKNDKWDIEEHSRNVAKAHPMIFVVASILSNVISFYKIYDIIQSDIYNNDYNEEARSKIAFSHYSDILFIVVLNFFLVDLLSGLLHIVLDNPEFLNTPYISKLAYGFQQHHINTTLVVKMKLKDHIRPMSTAIVFMSLIGFLIHGMENYKLYTYIITFSCYICLMQCSHRWSHMNAINRNLAINKLQSLHIVLKPEDHMKHHMEPYLENFCIMNGAFNSMLNTITKLHPLLHPHSKIWLPIFVCGFILPIIFIPL